MAKILLVDDDPQALSSTQKILELSGFEVVTAIDGQAALDAIRKPGVKTTARFDVVLSDVRMP
ncbi:MAG: response regulator, partial [Bdellovibrionota bacterium]